MRGVFFAYFYAYKMETKPLLSAMADCAIARALQEALSPGKAWPASGGESPTAYSVATVGVVLSIVFYDPFYVRSAMRHLRIRDCLCVTHYASVGLVLLSIVAWFWREQRGSQNQPLSPLCCWILRNTMHSSCPSIPILPKRGSGMLATSQLQYLPSV